MASKNEQIFKSFEDLGKLGSSGSSLENKGEKSNKKRGDLDSKERVAFDNKKLGAIKAPPKSAGLADTGGMSPDVNDEKEKQLAKESEAKKNSEILKIKDLLQRAKEKNIELNKVREEIISYVKAGGKETGSLAAVNKQMEENDDSIDSLEEKLAKYNTLDSLGWSENDLKKFSIKEGDKKFLLNRGISPSLWTKEVVAMKGLGYSLNQIFEVIPEKERDNIFKTSLSASERASQMNPNKEKLAVSEGVTQAPLEKDNIRKDALNNLGFSDSDTSALLGKEIKDIVSKNINKKDWVASYDDSSAEEARKKIEDFHKKILNKDQHSLDRKKKEGASQEIIDIYKRSIGHHKEKLDASKKQEVAKPASTEERAILGAENQTKPKPPEKSPETPVQKSVEEKNSELLQEVDKYLKSKEPKEIVEESNKKIIDYGGSNVRTTETKTTIIKPKESKVNAEIKKIDSYLEKLVKIDSQDAREKIQELKKLKAEFEAVWSGKKETVNPAKDVVGENVKDAEISVEAPKKIPVVVEIPTINKTESSADVNLDWEKRLLDDQMKNENLEDSMTVEKFADFVFENTNNGNVDMKAVREHADFYKKNASAVKSLIEKRLKEQKDLSARGVSPGAKEFIGEKKVEKVEIEKEKMVASGLEKVYENLNKEDLIAWAKERGIASDGDKQNVIDRLIQNDIEKKTTDFGFADNRTEAKLKEYNLSERDMISMSPEFFTLSADKQFYILQKIEQKIYLDAQIDSKDDVEQKLKEMSPKHWYNFGQGIKKSFANLKKGHSEVNLREQKIKSIKEGGLKDYVTDLETYSSFLKDAPELKYIANEKGKLVPVFEHVEVSEEKTPHRAAQSFFNMSASQLGEIPFEWSSSNASSSEKQKHHEAMTSYKLAKEALFKSMNEEAKAKNPNETPEEAEARQKEISAKIIEADGRIAFGRYITQNPEIENKSKLFFEKLLGGKVDKVATGLAFAGVGYATKWLGRSMAITGVGLAASAAVGGFISYRNKNLEFSEKELRQRYRGEAKDLSVKKPISFKKSYQRLEELVLQFESGESEKGAKRDKDRTLERLKTRLFVNNELIESQRVDFGSKKEASYNQLKMSELTARASVLIEMNGGFSEEDTPEGKLFDRYKRFIGDEKVDNFRENEKDKAILKGMATGAIGFMVGSGIRSGQEYLTKNAVFSRAWDYMSENAVNGLSALKNIISKGAESVPGTTHSVSGNFKLPTVNLDTMRDVQEAAVDNTYVAMPVVENIKTPDVNVPDVKTPDVNSPEVVNETVPSSGKVENTIDTSEYSTENAPRPIQTNELFNDTIKDKLGDGYEYNESGEGGVFSKTEPLENSDMARAGRAVEGDSFFRAEDNSYNHIRGTFEIERDASGNAIGFNTDRVVAPKDVIKFLQNPRNFLPDDLSGTDLEFKTDSFAVKTLTDNRPEIVELLKEKNILNALNVDLNPADRTALEAVVERKQEELAEKTGGAFTLAKAHPEEIVQKPEANLGVRRAAPSFETDPLSGKPTAETATPRAEVSTPKPETISPEVSSVSKGSDFIPNKEGVVRETVAQSPGVTEVTKEVGNVIADQKSISIEGLNHNVYFSEFKDGEVYVNSGGTTAWSLDQTPEVRYEEATKFMTVENRDRFMGDPIFKRDFDKIAIADKMLNSGEFAKGSDQYKALENFIENEKQKMVSNERYGEIFKGSKPNVPVEPAPEVTTPKTPTLNTSEEDLIQEGQQSKRPKSPFERQAQIDVEKADNLEVDSSEISDEESLEQPVTVSELEDGNTIHTYNSKEIKGEVKFVYREDGTVEKIQVGQKPANRLVVSDEKDWENLLNKDWKEVLKRYGLKRGEVENQMIHIKQLEGIMKGSNFTPESKEGQFILSEIKAYEFKNRALMAK